MVRISHIVTITTTKTTAPKNHSALLPDSPGPNTKYPTMARPTRAAHTSQPMLTLVMPALVSIDVASGIRSGCTAATRMGSVVSPISL